jgi:hypothetical protein
MNPLPPSFASLNPSLPTFDPSSPGSLGLPNSPTTGMTSQLTDDGYFMRSIAEALNSNFVDPGTRARVMLALSNSDLSSLDLGERTAILNGVKMIGSPNLTPVQQSNQVNTVLACIDSYSNNAVPGTGPAAAPAAPAPVFPGLATPATTLPTFVAPAPFVFATPTPAPATPTVPTSASPGSTLSNGLFVSDASLSSSDQFGRLVQQTLRQSGMLPFNDQSGSGLASVNAMGIQALMMLDTSALSSEQRLALLEQISDAAEDQNFSIDELNSIFAAAGPQFGGTFV